MAASRRILAQYREDGNDYLDGIITSDETWIFLFDLETKEESRKWKTDSSPPPKTARQVKSIGKTDVVQHLRDELPRIRYPLRLSTMSTDPDALLMQ